MPLPSIGLKISIREATFIATLPLLGMWATTQKFNLKTWAVLLGVLYCYFATLFSSLFFNNTDHVSSHINFVIIIYFVALGCYISRKRPNRLLIEKTIALCGYLSLIILLLVKFHLLSNRVLEEYFWLLLYISGTASILQRKYLARNSLAYDVALILTIAIILPDVIKYKPVMVFVALILVSKYLNIALTNKYSILFIVLIAAFFTYTIMNIDSSIKEIFSHRFLKSHLSSTDKITYLNIMLGGRIEVWTNYLFALLHNPISDIAFTKLNVQMSYLNIGKIQLPAHNIFLEIWQNFGIGAFILSVYSMTLVFTSKAPIRHKLHILNVVFSLTFGVGAIAEPLLGLFLGYSITSIILNKKNKYEF